MKDVINSFNDIYNQCSSLAKKLKIDYVSLNIIKVSIDGHKIKKLTPKEADLVNFAKEYNKMLDVLYSTCVKHSKSYNEERNLHLMFLRQFIDEIISNLNVE